MRETRPAHLGATILLVDDHPANLNVLIEHLLAGAYHIMVAESGESALKRLQHRTPDLILLDVSMPGINGYETCRRIKMMPDSAEIPVIFLSAFDDTNDKLEGFKAGGVDYIAKPLDIPEVMARVRTHLTLRNLQLELAEHNRDLRMQHETKSLALERAVRLAEKRDREKKQLLSLLDGQRVQIRLVMERLLANATEREHLLLRDLSRIFSEKLDLLREQLANVAEPLASLEDADDIETSLAFAQQIIDDIAFHLAHLPDHAPSATATKSQADFSALSQREKEILRYVVDGLSNRDIATEAHIAETTVRTYKRRIMKKLNVSTVSALVRVGLEQPIQLQQD